MCLNKVTPKEHVTKIGGLYETRQYQLSAAVLDDNPVCFLALGCLLFGEDEVVAFCGSFKFKKKNN